MTSKATKETRPSIHPPLIPPVRPAGGSTSGTGLVDMVEIVARASTAMREPELVLVDASTSFELPLARSNREASRISLLTLDNVRGAEPSISRNLAFMRADWWLRTFPQLAANRGLEFNPPHITTSDDEVVFEWWLGNRKLTFYVSGARIEYIKVWGTNIFDDMAEGILEAGGNEFEVWAWLLKGPANEGR